MADATGEGPVIQFGPIHRFAWNAFPSIVLAAEESAVKRHAEYDAAKTGDVPAAKRLAADLTTHRTIDSIRALIADRRWFRFMRLKIRATTGSRAPLRSYWVKG